MNHLDFIARDILIEQDAEGYVWLTQNEVHYCFPRGMVFTRDIEDLHAEGYLGFPHDPDYAGPMTVLRPVETH